MHSDLIAKLEALDGPSREVDRLIHEAFNKTLKRGLRFGYVPNYTASLDATVALVERVLPGVPIAIIDGWLDGRAAAFVAHQGSRTIDLMKSSQGTSYTRTIALLIATLKALEARDG